MRLHVWETMNIRIKTLTLSNKWPSTTFASWREGHWELETKMNLHQIQSAIRKSLPKVYKVHVDTLSNHLNQCLRAASVPSGCFQSSKRTHISSTKAIGRKNDCCRKIFVKSESYIQLVKDSCCKLAWWEWSESCREKRNELNEKWPVWCMELRTTILQQLP